MGTLLRISQAIAWSCFNPCCIGLGVGTYVGSAEAARHSRFQSLLYWIGRGDVTAVEQQVGLVLEFQSLLYWIGRGDSQQLAASRRKQQGFNPCCIGLGVGTFRSTSLRKSANTFQSLLYWIGRGDRATKCQWICCWRFNPCCIGLGVGTSSAVCPRMATAAFQSLLYWIGRGDSDWPAALTVNDLFQSLLYWIGRGDRASGPGGALK